MGLDTGTQRYVDEKKRCIPNQNQLLTSRSFGLPTHGPETDQNHCLDIAQRITCSPLVSYILRLHRLLPYSWKPSYCDEIRARHMAISLAVQVTLIPYCFCTTVGWATRIQTLDCHGHLSAEIPLTIKVSISYKPGNRRYFFRCEPYQYTIEIMY